jgi:hypothetical protein
MEKITIKKQTALVHLHLNNRINVNVPKLSVDLKNQV